MSQMLTVPAEILVQLRGGLLEELGFVASDISTASVRDDRYLYPERLTVPVERFDRHRSLLDVIGWTESNEPAGVDIDLSVHCWALLAALESLLTAERDLADLPPHMAGTDDQQSTAERHVRELEQFLDTIYQRTARAERLIVLLILDDEHPEAWTHAEIDTALGKISPLEISVALTHLDAEGVVTLDEEQIEASRCAWHLVRLELIAV
jgi:hypothetical protein